MVSDRDGWRHVYLCSTDGKEMKLITPGEFDVIKLLSHLKIMIIIILSPHLKMLKTSLQG